MPDNFAAGQRFASRFELLECVGTGSTGSVFKARQLACDSIVAIKILKIESSTEERERFLREAKALSKLSHKNIVQVFHIGVTEGDQYYLAMEYISGVPLASVLAKEKFRLATSCNIIEELALALAYVHKCGIIHRDIKPSNIILTETPKPHTAKLIDFSLARVDDGGSQRLTRSNTLIGSPQYMSPEQCEGQQADSRSDVYALCACFYEMLSQRKLFEAESTVGLMYEHIKTEVPLLPEEKWGPYTNELNKILQCGLAKNPDDRFQSMSELYDSIVAFRERFANESFSEFTTCENESLSARPAASSSIPILKILVIVLPILLLIVSAWGFVQIQKYKKTREIMSRHTTPINDPDNCHVPKLLISFESDYINRATGPLQRLRLAENWLQHYPEKNYDRGKVLEIAARQCIRLHDLKNAQKFLDLLCDGGFAGPASNCAEDLSSEWLSAGHPSIGLEVLDQVLSKFRGDLEWKDEMRLLSEKGKMNLSLHHYDQAYALLNQARELKLSADGIENECDQDHAYLHITVMAIRGKQNELEKVINDCIDSAKLRNMINVAQVYEKIAKAFNEAGQESDSTKYYELALDTRLQAGQSDEKIFDVLTMLSRVYIAQGQRSKAIELYKRVIKQCPDPKLRSELMVELSRLYSYNDPHNLALQSAQ